jgi:predicted ATP-grasp superfamily ATP-dependent carboligase
MPEKEKQAANRKPTALLISTSPSFSPARLCMAMAKHGFDPQAVCPARHSLRKTRAVTKVYSYNCLAPLRSVAKAIVSAKPELVIPCDDWAGWVLHELYSREKRKANAGQEICSLIERSLGSPQSFRLPYERATFLNLARQEGLRVPETRVISGSGDLAKWAAEVGFPAVLKANGTSGGEGVRVVHTLEEAERAFRALQAPPMLVKALKWVLIDKDMALLWPSLLRKQYVVNIQAFVAGRDATSAIACWKGEVLASLHFEVLNKQHAGGPSTVLRLIENEDMSATAQRMARRLELSGLHGFDFILETRTGNGNAHLIEMNPRATQVGHLMLGPGHDLPAALYAALTGADIQAAPKVTDKDTIALFPQEWLKNPSSTYLRSAYHDIPWEEPEFILACLERRQKQNTWFSMQKWIQVFSKARQT